MLTWYYNRKLSRNQLKLKTLKDEKKKMLDKVMDTETYKSAKIILEKFAPEQIRKSTSTTLELTPSRSSIEAPSISVSSAGELVAIPKYLFVSPLLKFVSYLKNKKDFLFC